MRWMLVVVALALVACGGADDGGAFGGSTAGDTATHEGTTTGTSQSGFPSGYSFCDESRRARFDVPGKTAAELVGHYVVYEYVPVQGSVPDDYVVEPSYVDEAVIIEECHRAGDKVKFVGN